MPVLPALSGREVVRVFERLGWQLSRQHGSHAILTREGRAELLSVPLHSQVKRGTLRGLIRTARISVEELINAVRA